MQARLLLLERQLVEFVAQRIQLVFAGQPLLLQLLQIDRGVFQDVARLAQRLLASLAHQQGRLQLLLRRIILADRQVCTQLGQVLLELHQGIGDLLNVVLQVGDLLGAGLGKETRFLQGMLRVLRAAALLAQCKILGVGIALRLVDLRIESGDLLAQYRHLFVDAVLLALFCAEQIGRFLHLALDLRGPFHTALVRLVELEYVHLQAVQALLQLVARVAQRRDLGFDGLVILLGLRDLPARILRATVLLDQFQFQLLDLALPRQHAVQLAVRRMEQHAVRADQMSLRRDEPAARRKLRAQRIALRQRPPRHRHGSASRASPAALARPGIAHNSTMAATGQARHRPVRCRMPHRSDGENRASFAGGASLQAAAASSDGKASALSRSRNTASSASSQPLSMRIDCHRRGSLSN